MLDFSISFTQPDAFSHRRKVRGRARGQRPGSVALEVIEVDPGGFSGSFAPQRDLPLERVWALRRSHVHLSCGLAIASLDQPL